MGSRFAQAHSSKAQEYGLERHSWPMRDILAAQRMLAENGIGGTFAHARAILTMRVVWRLFDRKLQLSMPQALTRPTLLEGLDLRSVSETETQQAELCSAISSMTFGLALRALKIDPKDYHFFDIGSGWGYAALLAAMRPFRAVSGAEFARELNERAKANLNWARERDFLICERIDLRHESALKTELPEEPLLLFLYHPFGTDVLAQFLDRVDASMRRAPRPITAIYAGPLNATPFARPTVSELPLRGSAALNLRLFSPRPVRAWRWV